MSKAIKLSGHWPEWMDRDEARICNKLITAILSHGYLVRVRDEEGEVMCEPTSDRAAVQKETAATSFTVYDVMQPLAFQPGQPLTAARHARIGSFILVHGNGEDVVSDMTWRPDPAECEAVMEKIDRMAQGEPS